MPNFEMKFVGHNTREYNESVKLRNKILREPLGLSLSSSQIDSEVNTCYNNLIAVVSQRVIGILVIKKSVDFIQIFQIAIETAYQNQGIGSKLVVMMETHFLKEYRKVIVFSRLSSLSFYLHMGYIQTDYKSEIVGLSHVKLEKDLADLR